MKHPILKLKFVSLMIAGVFCFVPPVGAATQELRPLAKLERDLGRPNALEVDLRIKADDMYKSVVIGVLKDRSEIESALRQRYGDDSISLKNLKNIVVSFAGFGTTRFVYHLRFLFNDGRDMDLALYVFSRGGAYRNAELSTLAGIREDILKTGQDSITLSAFNPIDFTETLASEDQRTHYCLLAEYGGLDLDNIRHVLWKLFKNRAEAMSENELYNLVEIGLITDEEAEQLKTDKEGLADLIKKHLKTDDIDGFILRMENNGVAKYFQLYRKTQGRHIPDDPRRNNVLFRYDRHNDKWTCRLCDFENTSTTSLAELISSFQIFDKMYYEALRVPGLTVRHASSANVRAWHWTDKPIAKKTGFFKAAMAGLGGGEQAKRMLAEAMHEIQASTLMMSSDNCPYEALTHFLVQIGYVGYLKWVGPVAATGKTTAELESSVLRPLAAGERDSAHSYWDEYMRGVSEEDANLQAAAIDGAIKAGRVVLGADEALAGFFEDHIIKPM
jgi:hypothetical protein